MADGSGRSSWTLTFLLFEESEIMFIEIIFTNECIPKRQAAFILIIHDIKEEFIFYSIVNIEAQKMGMIKKRLIRKSFYRIFKGIINL